MKKTIKHILKFFGYDVIKSLPDSEKNYTKKSFSQCGEDLIVQYIFQLRNINLPTYLDIGANHPHYINNTFLFYKNGSRGINIEANPNLITNFKNERRDDINLNIGIGINDEELDFYIMEDDTLSTFSKDEFSQLTAHAHKLSEIKKIKLKTIDYIIKKYSKGIFPDFLSIDVEGLDYEIIKSISFEYSSPKVICIEAAEYSPIGAGKRRTELIDFLVTKNYYEYANTNLNAIMVRRDFWFINE